MIPEPCMALKSPKLKRPGPLRQASGYPEPACGEAQSGRACWVASSTFAVVEVLTQLQGPFNGFASFEEAFFMKNPPGTARWERP